MTGDLLVHLCNLVAVSLGVSLALDAQLKVILGSARKLFY